MAGRPLHELKATEAEAVELKRLARRPKSAQALALRARIVLQCAEGCLITKWLVGSPSRVRRFASGGHVFAAIDCRALATRQDRDRLGKLVTIFLKRLSLNVDVSSQGRDALDYARIGSRNGPLAIDDRARMAHLRSPTASHGNFQAVDRPILYRKDA